MLCVGNALPRRSASGGVNYRQDILTLAPGGLAVSLLFEILTNVHLYVYDNETRPPLAIRIGGLAALHSMPPPFHRRFDFFPNFHYGNSGQPEIQSARHGFERIERSL